jgi:small subunit ribosomal protein S13e
MSCHLYVLVYYTNPPLKAVAVRKHLERNRKDKDSKFRLILIESRIHRLSRYYKTVGVLPPTWRYESATASTLVA